MFELKMVLFEWNIRNDCVNCVNKYRENISINSDLLVFLQNYNTAAKPFGSPAPRPDVEAVTQQTSQLNFSP